MMNQNISIKTYDAPSVCISEILRYAKCGQDPQILQEIELLLKEIQPILTFKVAFCRLPVSLNGNTIDLSVFHTTSKDLAKNLSGCKSAILFAATIGLHPDRLIAKYSRISPAKALLLQAICTERIESLCELFTNDLEENGLYLRPRFSPGYGDLTITLQKDIIQYLDCTKNLGIVLNEQFLMIPTKSVTAIIGIEESKNECLKLHEK